jgi:hypothetical protein
MWAKLVILGLILFRFEVTLGLQTQGRACFAHILNKPMDTTGHILSPGFGYCGDKKKDSVQIKKNVFSLKIKDIKINLCLKEF